jgi:hypothetical protein
MIANYRDSLFRLYRSIAVLQFRMSRGVLSLDKVCRPRQLFEDIEEVRNQKGLKPRGRIGFAFTHYRSMLTSTSAGGLDAGTKFQWKALLFDHCRGISALLFDSGVGGRRHLERPDREHELFGWYLPTHGQ